MTRRVEGWLRVCAGLLLALQIGGATLGPLAESVLDDPATTLRVHMEGAQDPSCHTPHNHYLCQVFRWEATPSATVEVASSVPDHHIADPGSDAPEGLRSPLFRLRPPGRAPPTGSTAA